MPTSESHTEVIDLEGQLAIPGFIDSHVHFSGIGTAQLQLKLMDVANWDEVGGDGGRGRGRGRTR